MLQYYWCQSREYRIKTYVFLGIIVLGFYFNLYQFNSGRVVLQKRQVIVTSLGYCYRHILHTKNPNCQSSWKVLGKIGEGELEDNSGIIMEVEGKICVQNLDRRLGMKKKSLLVSVVVVVVKVVFFRALFCWRQSWSIQG